MDTSGDESRGVSEPERKPTCNKPSWKGKNSGLVSEQLREGPSSLEGQPESHQASPEAGAAAVTKTGLLGGGVQSSTGQ